MTDGTESEIGQQNMLANDYLSSFKVLYCVCVCVCVCVCEREREREREREVECVCV